MKKKLIISAALCGAGTTRKQTPYVPITPEEIAADAVACVKAGASIIHVHARDEDGVNTMETKRFCQVVDLIREKMAQANVDAVLNLTSSGSKFSDDVRLAHLPILKPEMCSYDPGTLNWAHSYIFQNSPAFLERLGRLCQEENIKPECEVFDSGFMGNIRYYAEKGVLTTPVHYQFVLGVAGGMPGNINSLAHLLPQMLPGSTWSISGIGRAHMPCMLAGLAENCDGLRVGLEDNVMLDKGVLATNVQLVERAVRLSEEAGRSIATAQEAREILHLTKHRKRRRNPMKNVVIVDACRTAVGKFGGTLKPLNAEALAAAVLKGVLGRTGLDPSKVDEVIMGHCRQSSDFSNTARYAALQAGIPEEVPANTVMCACASAMLAVSNGVNSIMTGQNDVVIAGGTESMTNANFYLSNARWGVGTGSTSLKDSLTEAQFCSQPQDVYGRFNMGMTAENVAARLNISREDQDAFALASQQKAAAAIAEGKFKDEIVPVIVPQGRKKDPIVFDTDEYPRETTLEKLGSLKPAFQPDGGSVTAGNASGRNDGASAMLLMSEEKAAELGLKPIARILGVASAGVDPRYMGLGPVPATRKVLERVGLTLDDIQLIELNEAFAAQSLGCIRELGLEARMDIINVNGGAIALGHPIGSSGCRIMVTLVHEMKKRGLRYGLATLCIAGGMGMAAVVEML